MRLLLSILVLLASQPAVLAAEQGVTPAKTLRVTLANSLKNPLSQNLIDFKNAIEEDSSGALRVEIFDNAQLYSETQGRAAVSSGAIDIAVVPLGDYAGDIPAAGLFQQPFLFDLKPLVLASTKRDHPIRKTIEQEILKKAGVRPLYWQPYGGTVLLSNGAPVTNPSAMAGRNVAAIDSGMGNFITNCGGKPRLVSAPETFKTLADKTADSSMTGILSLKERELWRVTNTVTKLRYSEILFLIVINEKSWQALTEDQRTLISEAAERVEQSIWRWYFLLEADTYQLAQEKGLKIQELTPDDISDWRICSSVIVESFMTDAGEIGEQLMNAYGKLRADPCCNR
ncbi:MULTISPECIES: TRAP transporter substrate-binding protein DctP [Rhodomicrobium]|uniref:TRAP transporter substrate-binding protein DctP n=1 Tax=Rhodomicrobium TaxID=1068 RepID=UPI000B4B5FFD|nr:MULTISPECIES: TRAP transporter substrate-binding protein DctP [Rhodomicrobium]